eukprot:m.166813 g.166813  ORF g.166813 m.166813 type:complete len:238 (-) comp14448_c1_seq1:1114-1827(-)
MEDEHDLMYPELIRFCEEPETDRDNPHHAYDRNTLDQLARNTLDAAPDDLVLKTILESHSFNLDLFDEGESGFTAHKNDLDVDITAMGHQLREQSTIPRQIGLQFCSQCHNMMAPEEQVDGERDAQECSLVYKCNHCGQIKPAMNDFCVFVHRAMRDEATLALIHSDITQDPTLDTKPMFCRKCGSVSRCVSFQSPVDRDTADMRFFFVCSTCEHKWKVPLVAKQSEEEEEDGNPPQ